MQRSNPIWAIGLLGALASGLGSLAVSSLLAPDAGAAPAQKKKRVKYLRVRKMRPRHGRTFVDPTAEVWVRFSKPIDPATVTIHSVKLSTVAGFQVEWTFRLEKNGRKLILTPSQVMDPATDYRFEVRPGLATEDGRTLKRAKRVLFFTDPNFKRVEYIRQEQLQQISGRLSVGRAFHSSAEMEDGTVLLSGGQTAYDPDSGISTLTPTCDVFEPDGVRFQALNSLMQNPRAFHPSAAIPGGAIVLGGWDGNDATDTTDVFDLSSYRMFAGPRMMERRDFHAATELSDGRVLVTGGLSYPGGRAVWSDTAEIYDPATGAFRYANGNPQRRRAGHRCTLLPDGRVVISGGEPSGSAAGTIEFFDPVTETFIPTTFSSSAGRQNHNVTQISAQGVLLFSDGGNALVEYFDPFTAKFSFAGFSSVSNRSQSTASLLPDGRVLIAGGLDATAEDTIALRTFDLFVPGLGGFGRVVRVQAQFRFSRAGHSAHSLPNGDVVFVGGVGVEGDESLSSAELLVVDKPQE